MRLKDRVALITGAGQGIGESIMRRFHAEGACVVGLDRSAEKLEPLCRSLGQRADFHIADNGDDRALCDAVARTFSKHKRIDILINNAGFSYYGPFVESTQEQWRRTFAINLDGHVVLSREVAKHMAASRYGRIVNISSIQAISCGTTVSAYAASKGAVIAFTHSLAVELAPYNILANCIAPGCVHTPMSIVNGTDETNSAEFQEWYVKRRKIPLARPAEPEEIANAALFLSSDECSYITGHTLVVDGGMTVAL
jgi:3-oxoacyl-[acyl-carrier protein] reductase